MEAKVLYGLMLDRMGLPVRSGYLLKDGLSNNEDFYYLNLLITITADNVGDLEWKVAEMKKLQLMALRMRRKGIQVFTIASLKGHEFHRACTNIDGEFIQISPASKNCINVMELRRADKSVDELLDGPGGVDKPLLAAKIQRLHIFFSLLIPNMNHEER